MRIHLAGEGLAGQFAGDQVHLGAADERGDEGVDGELNTSIGVPTCAARPSRITTMRSDRVIASLWSCGR